MILSISFLLIQLPLYQNKILRQEWKKSLTRLFCPVGEGSSVTASSRAYSEETKLLKNTGKPVIGICLGCELIAYTFGCVLKHNEVKQRGLQHIQIIDFTFFGKGENIEVYESHTWSISNLSHEIKPLAKSNIGIEAIAHIERPIYGFQFHPEKSPNTQYFRELLNKIISQKKIETQD